ncbi:uncharacterized protein [Mytilus edulis]|uniref:uncharacterized protein n=1 Tax=Mytilus edulis TaxID=6550 RepID=UPI0039EE3463
MMSAKRILSVFYILAYCTVTIFGEKKRLLENIPNNVDSRLHDIEVKLQQLTSQTTDKDMYITQLQSTVLKLQSTVNQLEHDRNNQSAQIQAMQKIVNAKNAGCQSGNHQLVDAKGHAQSASTVIHFKEPFAEIPTIVWGTTALDIDHNHNTRFGSSVQSITKAGFTMQAGTWSDTGIYSVQIQWMACPAHI